MTIPMPVPICRYDFAVGRLRPNASRSRRSPGPAQGPDHNTILRGTERAPLRPAARTGTLGEKMTDQPLTAEGTGLSPAARLEPNAIGVAQDTVIGMASS